MYDREKIAFCKSNRRKTHLCTSYSSVQVFCYASPLAKLPEELIAKINTSGLGFLSKWVPQHYILTHPVRKILSITNEMLTFAKATGWCLTHCGWGGVTEALGSGVPM